MGSRALPPSHLAASPPFPDSLAAAPMPFSPGGRRQGLQLRVGGRPLPTRSVEAGIGFLLGVSLQVGHSPA